MSKNILRALYDGKIRPHTRKENHSKEMFELVNQIENEEKYFINKLSLEDGERFKELLKLYSDLNQYGEENLFAYSFSLGILLGIDVVEEAESNFTEQS